MSVAGVRIVAIESLRHRLRDLLGEDSLLYCRLDRALAMQDDARVDAAMRSPALYPRRVRREVEDVMVRWLFDEPVPPLTQRSGPMG